MKTLLSLTLVVLSLIGLSDASYLTYEKMMGKLPTCGGGFDCGQVLESSWAQIGPIPVSALGMGFYGTVLLLAGAHFLELKLHPRVTTLQLLLLLTSIGLATSIFLVGLMAFVIQAWCLFCLISAATSTLLFVVTATLYYQGHEHFN